MAYFFFDDIDLPQKTWYSNGMRGDYFVVEKVKPDPLNLLVNTNVGKQSIHKVFDQDASRNGSVLFAVKLNIVDMFARELNKLKKVKT